MGNAVLNHAKDAKQDDFWTQLPEIQAECQHYRDQFRGKTILCNCDDPLVSNFVRYFALNFKAFGLKRLIATCYKNAQGDLFSTGKDDKACFFDYDGTEGFNSVEELVRMKKRDLGCDGDFRNPICIDLLKQADIVSTNPPFSLFREYVAQLMKFGKKFLIIGNINAIKYKEIFPLITHNQIWLGVSIHSGDREFQIPDSYQPRSASFRIDDEGRRFVRVVGVRWFTNLEHAQRHEPLPLWATFSEERYPHYINFDGIEVNPTNEIPKDYPGMMGVPITFIDKYCPDQFEIIGVSADVAKPMKEIKDWYAARPEQGHLRTGGDALYFWKGPDDLIRTYDRIVIRHKHPEKSK